MRCPARSGRTAGAATDPITFARNGCSAARTSFRHPQGEGVYDVETLRDDVLAVADAAGCERPVVIGHSLGALVALACAARPDAVRAAIMVDTAPIVNEQVKAFLANGADAVEDDRDGTWRK